MNMYNRQKITEAMKKYKEDYAILQKVIAIECVIDVLTLFGCYAIIIWGCVFSGFRVFHSIPFINTLNLDVSESTRVAIGFLLCLGITFSYFRIHSKWQIKLSLLLKTIILKMLKKSLHVNLKDAGNCLYDGYYIIKEYKVSKTAMNDCIEYITLNGEIEEETDKYEYHLSIPYCGMNYQKIPITSENYKKFVDAKQKGMLLVISKCDYENNTMVKKESYVLV